MLRPTPRRRAVLAALFGTALLLFPAASGGAQSSSLRRDASSLRARNATLESESRSAVVELYSLESRLSAARARVADLNARISSLGAELTSVRRQLGIVRHVAAVSRAQLGRRLVEIYENGEPDALAVILGSDSLGEAATRLEQLNALTEQDQTMLDQARRANASLHALRASLTNRRATLQGLEGEAATAVSSLDIVRTDRLQYLTSLSSERRLNDGRIQSLETQAQAAETRSRQLAASDAIAPPPTPAAPAPPPVAPASSPAGRTLTVVATAYALRGSTATGIPVGPGIVAVDPSVIPLGTHMTIPGYGEGVAADTGSAIKGNRIDVWVASEAQASQWGVQTVTITLH